MSLSLNKIFPHAGHDLLIRELALDSRNVRAGDLFLAVPGGKFDGRAHIADALARGAAAVAYEVEGATVLPITEVPLIPVKGLAAQLSDIAGRFYGEPSHHLKLVGVTGTNGKTVVARLVARLLQLSGKHTGLACSDGLFLDRRQVESGDRANWEAGHRILMNRAVEAAVFENDSGSILSEGLAYDRCQVGVVTNFDQPDHLGDYYVEDEDRMYNVLRTQVDVVLQNGAAVLNARDARLVEMAELCDGDVIFFGLTPELPAIISHRAAGKRAVYVREGKIVLATGTSETALVDVAAVPLTYAGRVAFQIENVLAAVAAGWALGISNDLIRAGVVTFDVGQVDVPGRFTLFERNGATVVVDDAHNAPALEALATALERFPAERRMVVYGAGVQRRDDDLVRQGKVLGQHFDRVFLCEDRSVKRALPDAEARALLKQGLYEGRRVTKIIDEGTRASAIEAALGQLVPGDLLVLQCDEAATGATVDLVHHWMGQPARRA